ncbi:hypothetical protein [Ancylobacter oerskovii]|uniref:Uncharacterized protein n=1 Tax=Ancylobacter oerskovii TaxID=459519 RepID=A0ABW4YU47_9HYPH|nr:hypothetical protein [Ancylobacter oerskovii]MBS7543566.1 hypothetical protein [Ancylobacter oerskovii]
MFGALAGTWHGGLPSGRRERARAGAGAGQIWPALLLLVVSIPAIGLAALGAGAGTDHVAVVAPPWYGPAQTLALVDRAGGRFVDVGRYGNVVVATVGEGDRRMFLDALSREGAWLTLDAGSLAGCTGR